MNNRLEYGTIVTLIEGNRFPPGFQTGRIVGVMLTEVPVLGCGYAVDFGRKISEEYPYPVAIVFAAHLLPATEDEIQRSFLL